MPLCFGAKLIAIELRITVCMKSSLTKPLIELMLWMSITPNMRPQWALFTACPSASKTSSTSKVTIPQWASLAGLVPLRAAETTDSFTKSTVRSSMNC